MTIFDQIPLTRRGHFLLHFYAAIYRLLFYLNRLEEADKDRRDFEETFKQYPFLGGYFEEICGIMPQELTWESALKWWKEQITAWEEKVSFHLPLRAVRKLRELEKRCRYREKLFDNLGPAFGSVRNTGVRALFNGASGTGKTLAARILAAELGMDLYRVDLAAVVNKYIGETEKNLHKVLTRVEELDVILLLNEGDALLGTRTEVKTANDRYANMETDYLLQKLENYQGIVIITTNAVENIDNAFQRRMDVVVSFVPPQAQERLLIWQLHLPVDHEVDDAALENAALRCAMTGGQIRNATLNAALLALDENRKVSVEHFVEAIHSEYRKAGAICPLKESISQSKKYEGDSQGFFNANKA